MSLNGVKASAVAEMKVNGAGTFWSERQPGCLMDWKRYGNGRSLRRKVSIRLIPLCPSGQVSVRLDGRWLGGRTFFTGGRQARMEGRSPGLSGGRCRGAGQ